MKKKAIIFSLLALLPVGASAQWAQIELVLLADAQQLQRCLASLAVARLQKQSGR